MPIKFSALSPHALHPRAARTLQTIWVTLWMTAWAAASTGVLAQATSPAQLQQRYQAEAGSAPQAARGQAFFTRRHGGAWSCASCHHATPTRAGRHAVTGKTLSPLAPAFNPQAFTDERHVEKWFRRNCKDVVQRECSAAEKADVLAWLRSLN